MGRRLRRNGASATAFNVHARFWVSSAVAGSQLAALRLGSAVDEAAADETAAAKPADARFPHTRSEPLDRAHRRGRSVGRQPGPRSLRPVQHRLLRARKWRLSHAGVRVATPALATQTGGGAASPGPQRWSFLSRVRDFQARHGVASRRGVTRAAPRRGPGSRPARVGELEARHGVAEEARVVPIQAHERLQAAVGKPAIHLQHHSTRHFARAAVARAASRRPAASASRPSPHSWRPYRLPGTCTPMSIRAQSPKRTCKE